MTRARDTANIDTILTTKGDIYAATAAFTPGRLAVGESGSTLLADSSTSTGLRWGKDPVSDLVTTAGDTLYATAADTLTRLPIGATGQVLTVSEGVPSWATPAGASTSWSLLNSGGTSLSGSATVTVSGISGRSKILVLVQDASSGSSLSTIGVRINGDTGNNYWRLGSNFQNVSTYDANLLTGLNSTASNFIALGMMSTNAASRVNGYSMIDGGNASGVKSHLSGGAGSPNGGDSQAQYISSGIWNSSSTITSISVFSNTGNFDSGTFWVYASNV